MKRRKKTNADMLNRLDELFASSTEPLPLALREREMANVRRAMAELETAPAPGVAAWKTVADTVNMTEAIVMLGLAEDASGLLRDAVQAMGRAGARLVDHGLHIRLDGAGLQAVRAVVESYGELIDALPARTMYRVHRLTAERMARIVAGDRAAGDIVVEI